MTTKGLILRLALIWVLVGFSLFYNIGCASKILSGGKSNSTLGGIGQTTVNSFNQPSNPNESASASATRNETTEEPTPLVSSRITETKGRDGVVTIVREEFAPVMRKNRVETTSNTKVGGAHKDNSLEIVAKITAMRPVQFVGVALMVIAAGIMFYAPLRIVLGGGKQFPIALGFIGLGLVVSPQIISGHETVIIITAAIASLIYWLTIRLTRKEAESDLSKL